MATPVKLIYCMVLACQNSQAARRFARSSSGNEAFKVTYEVVTLDSSEDCQPSSDHRCTYKTINKNSPYLIGQSHLKVGKGFFADAMIVATEDSNDSATNEKPKLYVWKRYGLLAKYVMSGMIAKARESLTIVKNLQCPHVLAPLDLNPVVKQEKKRVWRYETVHADNGFIFEKLDGDAESWLKWAKVNDPGKLQECGPSFIHEMLAALGCLRQAGYVHQDVKLDNVLYKKSSNESCPSWFLTDFDFLKMVGEKISVGTPPLLALEKVKVGGIKLFDMDQKILKGTEDFYALALAYRDDFDNSVTSAQFDAFANFIADRLDCGRQENKQRKSYVDLENNPGCKVGDIATAEECETAVKSLLYPGENFEKGYFSNLAPGCSIGYPDEGWNHTFFNLLGRGKRGRGIYRSICQVIDCKPSVPAPYQFPGLGHFNHALDTGSALDLRVENQDDFDEQ